MTAALTTRTSLIRRIVVMLLIVLIGGMVVATSPAEATLGNAVKLVYVHVAFSQAGVFGMVVAGLMGLGVLATGHQGLSRLMVRTGAVFFGLFVMGLFISAFAQAATWGGIAWREPRLVTALNGVAFGVIVIVGAMMIDNDRIKGAAHAILGFYIAYSQLSARNVLHPNNAISDSASSAIRLSNLALLGLAVGLGVWLVWELRQSSPATEVAN